MSELIERIEQDIIGALESDTLMLATLPEVSLRVREVTHNPDASIADLVQIIGSDPAISARFIKVCSSPLLRAAQPVENLQMAVNRLGAAYSADLASSLAMTQIFQATSDPIDQRMRDAWKRSHEISRSCYVLAQNYTSLPAGLASLAGLIHLIGVLPILRYAEDNPDLLPDNHTLNKVIDRLHPKVGTMILKAWNFSDELCQVPSHYLDFDRRSEQADFVDLVMVANLQNHAGTSHPYTKMDWSKIPAFAQLGLAPDQSREEDLTANMTTALKLMN